MIRWRVFDQTPKTPIRKIGSKVMETKVGTMVTITESVNMSEMGITTVIITLTVITIVTKMIGVGPMFPLKIVKLLLGTVELV